MELDLSVTEGEEDRMTVLQLGQIIQIMYKHCTEKYSDLIDIRFNHRVTSTGQNPTKGKARVHVEIGNDESDKRFDRIEADYVIGCDGAASAVRRSLFGRNWPGQTFDCKFIVQNVYYDGFEKYGWDGGNYMVDRDHWGLIARRGHGGLWRVTYGDNEPALTDEEYLKRREWHFREMLPGRPEPGDYRIEQTNMYAIHNRCAEVWKVGRILLAADAAHVCNPMGGYGCMSACLDVGGLADCLIGYYEGKASEEILETYAKVRREIFLKYIDARSVKNLKRVAESDPWNVAETDPFFGILRELNGDKEKLKEFLLASALPVPASLEYVANMHEQKWSSIEYDFTQHYDKRPPTNAHANGTSFDDTEEIQMIANQNI